MYNPDFKGNPYHAYWATNTGGNNGSQLIVSSSAPYLNIVQGTRVVWPIVYTMPPMSPVVSADYTAYAVPPLSWMVGFNESFVLDSNPSAAANLPAMPTNNVPIPQGDIQAKLLDLVTNHHVGLYRDIISMEMIAPNQGDQSYWGQLKSELEMFKAYNLYLDLSFGSPIPQWMSAGMKDSPTWSGWCPIPNSQGDWFILKNNIGWSVGQWLVAMANSDPSLASWMQTHLFIEGWNEFDAAGMMSGSTCVGNSGTATQAADLQNGIAYVLNQYGLQLQTLMPSMVTGNEAFLTQYYAAGGTGLPNVHIYFSGKNSVSSAVTWYEQAIERFQKALPANLANRIFITETGMPDIAGGCVSGGILESDRQLLYSQLLGDSKITSATEGIIFWRLNDLPIGTVPGVPCESTFGAIDTSGAYVPSTLSIFNSISGF